MSLLLLFNYGPQVSSLQTTRPIFLNQQPGTVYLDSNGDSTVELTTNNGEVFL